MTFLSYVPSTPQKHSSMRRAGHFRSKRSELSCIQGNIRSSIIASTATFSNIDMCRCTPNSEILPSTILSWPNSDRDSVSPESIKRNTSSLFAIKLSIANHDPLFEVIPRNHPISLLDLLRNIRTYLMCWDPPQKVFGGSFLNFDRKYQVHFQLIAFDSAAYPASSPLGLAELTLN